MSWGSIDDKDYKLMGQIDPVSGHGLRMRTLDLGAGMAVRFRCAWAKAKVTASIPSLRLRLIAKRPRPSLHR
jgi:hypothetical protein